jgi:hypothetical protein
MKGLKPLADLIGSAEPLDPATMQFRAKSALVWVSKREALESERACNGCVFKGQRAKVCVQAGIIARLAGQHDCEERDTVTDMTFIYQTIPIDPRQLTIE